MLQDRLRKRLQRPLQIRAIPTDLFDKKRASFLQEYASEDRWIQKALRLARVRPDRDRLPKEPYLREPRDPDRVLKARAFLPESFHNDRQVRQEFLRDEA